MSTDVQPQFLADEDIRQIIRDRVKTVYVPPSVYRLQFNANFTFRQAIKILPYLKQLGIETVYSSPYFQAAPGSNHGYDVTDHNKINAEIGTQEDFEAFCQTIKDLGMKQILDVVPNHMGIRGQNSLWLDVLENGPSSIYSNFFDIDWDPKKKELRNKVLIPVLGDHYGTILENQEIKLAYSNGEFSIYYWTLRLPINPKSYPLILEAGIEELKQQLKEEDKDFLEFQSVITAFRNLPSESERDLEKVRERNREKEIAKKRLAAISEKNDSIRNFIESRVELFNGKKGESTSFDPLDKVLENQAYRMAFWRVASEEINYRRFFDINELAALRVESKEVFELSHKMVFELIKKDVVHGLRIDHPDGLYDPPAYFRNLQRQYLLQILSDEFEARSTPSFSPLPAGEGKAEAPVEFERQKQEQLKNLPERLNQILSEKEFQTATPLFVSVEKILDRKEPLPADWNVHGTVGYDFLNALNGLFVDSNNEKKIDQTYEGFIGHKIDFEQLIYQAKKFFALVHMSSEINMLANRLDTISEQNRHYRDFTLNNLTVAIREVIASFPVYRTYITPEQREISTRDLKYIHIAIEKAKHRTPALIHSVYDFLKKILTLEMVSELKPEEERLYRDFILRFQQLTGPVMAKGLEDTSFYIYNRLVSLNEVGGDPTHFGTSLGDFHIQNQERSKRWPASFNASSTHDTKRSEDARMRINVLSEIPEEWTSQITKWALVNEKHKTLLNGTLEPRPNTEYFLYQALIAAWPFETLKDEDVPAFQNRIWNYALKSIREAKTDSNWVNPNLEYEDAVKKFVYQILTPGEDNLFLKVFIPFQRKIAEYGMLNSISAAVLKVASPGVAETYQGCELWNTSLVDPDNRQPVDYDLRMRMLDYIHSQEQSSKDHTKLAQDLIATRVDGKIKLYVLSKALRFCHEQRELFVGGEYIALKVVGKRERNAVAFLRKSNGKSFIVVAGRFFTELMQDAGAENSKLEDMDWGDTEVLLPKEASSEVWKDLFTQKEIRVVEEGENRKLRVSELFQILTVSMLSQPDSPK
jgi:(1->4)-alpha-D-glucan 1-alpha-D-glucosylmutase